jgi:hypothetical protein
MADLITDIWSMYALNKKNRQVENFMRRFPGVFEQLSKFEKADAPIDTTNVAGAFNIMYGAMVYDQVNREVNAHALLPKKPWGPISGLRIITDNPSTKGGAVSESGTLPDTIRLTPDELYDEPAFMMSTWEITDLFAFKTAHDDGIGNAEAWYRSKFSDIHSQYLNETLLADASADAAAANANTTNAKVDAGDYFESLDRMVSNDSEEDAFGGTYTGWFDVYQSLVDRDAEGLGESYVSHNSGTDRTLTLGMLDTAIQNLEDNGGSDVRSRLVMLTGRDTYNRIKQLVGPQWKIDMDTIPAAMTINGLQTYAGKDATFQIRTYEGIPIVVDKNVTQDTLSRIYFVDTGNMEIRVGMPTVYMSADNKILLDALKTKYAYLTVQQLYCTRFNTQGKIRDLK